ncbi:MAG: hypothetical protein O3C43_22420 [Verrucomicrobia bacterium]|nr:hypothetical protein [Verrucomicrobiota bacterium]MDA1069248.1 hypothetical protein [Verrucomicrobiota bacterium]
MKVSFQFLVFLLVLTNLHSRTVEIGKGDLIVDPFSVAFDKSGNLYGVEYVRSNRVFKVDPYGVVTRIAGIQAVTDPKMGDLGANDGADPLNAHFNGMHDLAIGPDGSIYLADAFSSRVRKIDGATGKLSTIAGTGTPGFSGDGGPAESSQVGQVHCLSFNEDYSRLYLTDLPNRRIRMIDMESGIISTVAGNGETGVPEDQSIAIESPLLDPRAVLAGNNGMVYILSRRGNALRLLGPGGRTRTIINSSGEKGYSGDGGDALSATMNGPKHLALDPQGRILITDTENHCIRRYDPITNIIDLVAGVPGVRGSASSDNPLEIQFDRPHGSRVHNGWIFISDSENDRVISFPYPED